MAYLPLEKGDRLALVENSQPLHEDLFIDIETVLFSRDCPYDLNQLLELKKKYGFKLIVDIDDWWNLPHNHILYENWKRDKIDTQIIQSIINADLVTTTHERLRDKIFVYNKNVEILPNALPYGDGQFGSAKRNTNSIVYSAGVTHLNDIKTLSRFFELCKQDSDIQSYRLILAGYNDKNIYSKVQWDKMEAEAKKYGNYTRANHLALDSYMFHYLNANIAIAPLEDNEFNKCKSFLKGLEAGAKNIPLLASAIHPYTELPLIHCKNSRDWYENLKKLIKNPDLIEEKGKILGTYVRNEFNLIEINKLRKQLYER